jgi:hypothetical protein
LKQWEQKFIETTDKDYKPPYEMIKKLNIDLSEKTP